VHDSHWWTESRALFGREAMSDRERKDGTLANEYSQAGAEEDERVEGIVTIEC